MTAKRQVSLIPAERIEHSILLIRGQKVMLDVELAALYGVETKALNQAVTRNLERFPDDFMFQLTAKEYRILRSQSVTSSSWGGRRCRPRAFTEQGVAMLSSVLRSQRAVAVNIEIMRAFVRLPVARVLDQPLAILLPKRLQLALRVPDRLPDFLKIRRTRRVHVSSTQIAGDR